MNAVADTQRTMSAPYEAFEPADPPHSTEAEQSLLGALLLDNAALPLVGDLVGPESFFHHAHRLILAAITGLLSEGRAADVITVFERLSDSETIVEIGGLKYLHSLAMSIPSARNVRTYAQIVADRYAERMLQAGADEAATISRETGAPLADRRDRIASVMSRVEQAAKGVGRRVPLLGLEELQQAAKQVRWLVKRVVPADSIGMLFGASQTFKSFVALDMALHVAHGLPFMGRRTDKGPVVYIAAEGGAGLWKRIEAWHRARNASWKSIDFHVVPVAVDLAADAWRVVDRVQACGVHPVLVVVDTLSQTYSGEENSANEMAAYMRELGVRFRALWNCTVMLIHHSGHQATERPRGSSAIKANIDWLFGCHRDERELLATLSCQKQKDDEPFPDATFQMTVTKVGQDDEGDDITTLVARHLSTQEEVQKAQQQEAEAGRGGRDHALMQLVDNGMEEKNLRRAFYETLPSEADSHAKKMAYYRARDRAVKAGLLEVAEGLVIDLRSKK